MASKEEGIHQYKIGGFHPVRLGDVYYDKYKVLRKLGFGRYSTVWLVRNENEKKNLAMKVLSAECYGTDKDIFELEILQHLAQTEVTEPKHAGSSYVTRLIDSFTHEGVNGRHVCLVFNVMGESLSSFLSWFPDRVLPGPLLQHFTIQLLQALDFAHSRGVIHTDIQPNNILMQIPDQQSVIEYLDATHTDSQPVEDNHSAQDYTIISSQSLRDYYFPPDFDVMKLDLALSDWGVASFKPRHLTEHIQPVLLRAPEVILEAPWSTTVDIWNLGALVPELYFGQNMFSGEIPNRGYSTKAHLEEIAALLGPFPPSLLKNAGLKVTQEVFTEDGHIREPELSKKVPLRQRFSSLSQDGASKFEALVRSMLTIDPEKRRTAGELLVEPWLHFQYTGNLAF